MADEGLTQDERDVLKDTNKKDYQDKTGALQMLLDTPSARATDGLDRAVAAKKPRAKAYEALIDLQTGLADMMGGVGYEGFVIDNPRTTLVNPLTWPKIREISDHGADMRSKTMYVQYGKKANLDCVHDFFHGSWLDFCGTLKDVRLWCHVLIMTLTMSVAL